MCARNSIRASVRDEKNKKKNMSAATMHQPRNEFIQRDPFVVWSHLPMASAWSGVLTEEPFSFSLRLCHYVDLNRHKNSCYQLSAATFRALAH